MAMPIAATIAGIDLVPDRLRDQWLQLRGDVWFFVAARAMLQLPGFFGAVGIHVLGWRHLNSTLFPMRIFGTSNE